MLLIKRVLYIHYIILFKKNEIQILTDLKSKIDIITLVYIIKLGFKVGLISIGVQKVDSFILEIFEIVPASFQLEDKLRKPSFLRDFFDGQY